MKKKMEAKIVFGKYIPCVMCGGACVPTNDGPVYRCQTCGHEVDIEKVKIVTRKEGD